MAKKKEEKLSITRTAMAVLGFVAMSVVYAWEHRHDSPNES